MKEHDQYLIEYSGSDDDPFRVKQLEYTTRAQKMMTKWVDHYQELPDGSRVSQPKLYPCLKYNSPDKIKSVDWLIISLVAKRKINK